MHGRGSEVYRMDIEAGAVASWILRKAYVF